MTYALHTAVVYEKRDTNYLMWTCRCGNSLYVRKDKPIPELVGLQRACFTCGHGWVLGVTEEGRLKAVEL